MLALDLQKRTIAYCIAYSDKTQNSYTDKQISNTQGSLTSVNFLFSATVGILLMTITEDFSNRIKFNLKRMHYTNALQW